ncbi:MAG: flagellar basal body rod protein FlgC [Caulobacterales bacterium]
MSPAAAIALSGMTAATVQLTTSASNLANANDASAVGTPGYQPLETMNSPAPGGGVTAKAVTIKQPAVLSYDPTSPLANAEGLISTPEIDPIGEIGNQIVAGRAFAFSLKALEIADENDKVLLDLKT